MKNFWKDKHVLITGASGFIGSNACIYFSKLGSNVTGVISSKRSKKKLAVNLEDIGKQIKVKEVDLLSADHVRDLLKGQDAVFHFAAIDGSLHFKKLHSADIFSHNMRINLNILESSALYKIKHVLVVSSADIYTSIASGLITEKSPIAIDLTKDIDGYKLAKWTTELAMKEYTRQFGMNYIIVRPSNIYGPRDEFENEERMRLIPAIIKNVLSGKSVTLYGNGEQVRSFLYIEDFLSLCSKLVESGVYNKPINIASSNKISLRELATMIMRISNREAPIHIDTTKPAGVQLRAFNLSQLKKEVGPYKEIPLNEGLKNTIAFYKQHYF